MSKDYIKANIRQETGKNAMRRLRRQGRIPAVFYSGRHEIAVLTISEKELERAIARRKGLVNLEIEGRGNFEVIFREIQRDPVTDRLKHVDLLGITHGVKITSVVPVEIVGISMGVKTSGGILEVIRRELEVECLPKDLPEKIQVDVSQIDIGESIHAGDLELENVVILLEPQATIVTVVAPTVIKAAAEAAEAEAGEEEAPAEGESEDTTSKEEK